MRSGTYISRKIISLILFDPLQKYEDDIIIGEKATIGARIVAFQMLVSVFSVLPFLMFVGLMIPYTITSDQVFKDILLGISKYIVFPLFLTGLWIYMKNISLIIKFFKWRRIESPYDISLSKIDNIYDIDYIIGFMAGIILVNLLL